jgi:hypothetical protein
MANELVRLPNARHVSIAKANGHVLYEKVGDSLLSVEKTNSRGIYYASVDYPKLAV